MLYDILPPILLLFSFAGVIVVVSRTMIRVRAHEVSAEIQASVMSDEPVHAASIIGPNKENVHIVRNRLVHAFQIMGKSIRGIGPAIAARMHTMKENRKQQKIEKQEAKMKVVEQKELPKEEKKQKSEVRAKGIQLPEVSIQEHMENFASKGREAFAKIGSGMQSARAKMIARIPARAPQQQAPAIASPIIRLVHQEPAAEQKKGIVAQMMQRSKEETPLEKALRMIEENNFDEAEDILIPYIMKHASDTKAYMLLGKAAVGKGSWEDAMEIFQQVVKMNNNEEGVHAQLGHAAIQVGKFTLAMQELQRARDNDPENIGIREDLLFIARRMDNKVLEKGVLEELAALQEKAKAV